MLQDAALWHGMQGCEDEELEEVWGIFRKDYMHFLEDQLLSLDANGCIYDDAAAGAAAADASRELAAELAWMVQGPAPGSPGARRPAAGGLPQGCLIPVTALQPGSPFRRSPGPRRPRSPGGSCPSTPSAKLWSFGSPPSSSSSSGGAAHATSGSTTASETAAPAASERSCGSFGSPTPTAARRCSPDDPASLAESVREGIKEGLEAVARAAGPQQQRHSSRPGIVRHFSVGRVRVTVDLEWPPANGEGPAVPPGLNDLPATPAFPAPAAAPVFSAAAACGAAVGGGAPCCEVAGDRGSAGTASAGAAEAQAASFLASREQWRREFCAALMPQLSRQRSPGAGKR